MSNTEIIDEIVGSCVRQLFASQGAVLEPALRHTEPHAYVAVIGFSGDTMRGALGLGLDRSVLCGVLGAADLDAEDFIGETANQLIGRVKNKLLDCGVTLGIALPMVLRGVEVFLRGPTADVRHFRYTCFDGGLSVWFDARIDDGVSLVRCAAPELIGAHEGELTMF